MHNYGIQWRRTIYNEDAQYTMKMHIAQYTMKMHNNGIQWRRTSKTHDSDAQWRHTMHINKAYNITYRGSKNCTVLVPALSWS